MSHVDYYRILGVSRQVSDEDLKKAYRRLAIKWHPDRNPGSPQIAEERFKTIAEAYAVLSHPQHRMQYDVMGATDFKKIYTTEKIFQGFEPGDIFKVFGLEDVLDTLNRIMNSDRDEARTENHRRGVGDFFSGFGQKSQSLSRSPDIMVNLVITFAEAALGAEKEAAYNAADGPVKIPVKVPPGAVNGQRIVLPGQGPAKVGSRAGDIVISLTVTPDPQFAKKGFNLLSSLDLTEKELAEGCRPVLHSLTGQMLRLNVPPGTKSGTVFKLPAYGLPKPGGGRGDLLVRVTSVSKAGGD